MSSCTVEAVFQPVMWFSHHPPLKPASQHQYHCTAHLLFLKTGMLTLLFVLCCSTKAPPIFYSSGQVGVVQVLLASSSSSCFPCWSCVLPGQVGLCISGAPRCLPVAVWAQPGLAVGCAWPVGSQGRGVVVVSCCHRKKLFPADLCAASWCCALCSSVTQLSSLQPFSLL